MPCLLYVGKQILDLQMMHYYIPEKRNEGRKIGYIIKTAGITNFHCLFIYIGINLIIIVIMIIIYTVTMMSASVVLLLD